MDTFSTHRHETPTLVEALRARAQADPDRLLFTFLPEGEGTGLALTYGELDRQARAIAANLQNEGLAGERALLLFPPGLEYVAAFFGCLYAGVTAVPAYPPDAMRLERTLPRFLAIIHDAQPALALTTAPILGLAQFLVAQYPELGSLRWIATDEIAAGGEAGWVPPHLAPDSLAFLQYTSGSTSDPRGVMLSHANLMHNLEMICQAFQITADERAVSWLPFYHDMGLIGGILAPVYRGIPATLMSPLHFLQRPMRWLEAIHNTRATASGGPNFAYELCIRKSTPEQRQRLDLSCWTLAFSGAEPVRAETLARFAEVFAPCGFRAEALYPCYGMAEATLLVSGGSRAAPPVILPVDGARLAQNQVAPAAASPRQMVGCGHPWLGQTAAIVDPETQTPLPDGRVGEIWVAGGSVAQGYWNRPEASQRTFCAYLNAAQPGDPLPRGPYLRTGDLGFLWQGELYIAGRSKDLIIVNGQNHYPQDIELTVEKSHPAVRPGSCAAFSIDGAGPERVVVIAEVAPERNGAQAAFDPEAIKKDIRREVAEKHELRLHDVALIRSGSLPKTSSGKVQRFACRAGYLANLLERWEPAPAQAAVKAG